jgi:formate hydrogenlyase transcriptional activator
MCAVPSLVDRIGFPGLQLLTDSIPALIHTSRPDGYLDYFNRRWLEYVGVPLEEFEGWKWTGFIHPDDLAGIVERWHACLASGEVFEYEARVRRADGQYRWMSHSKIPLRDERGQIVKWYGSSIDIDDQKRTEQARRQSEFYLSEGQRLAHMGSWAFDPSGFFAFWSPELFQIYGLDQARGAPTLAEYLATVHPMDREFMAETIKRMLAERSGCDVKKRIVRPGGAVRHVRCVGIPVCEGAIFKGFVGTAMDVTEQEELTAELRERQTALEKAVREVQTLKDQLYKENIALRDEIDKTSMFEEIVGSSEALRKILSQVTKVAPTDSTVIILGETGTGKELIARAIHSRSNRSTNAFIRVSCSAIPSSLIASELFGHEKGAFTGASQRRIGRFESAEGGTIFLDEVGDLPMETQVALLRVLQEREFERVGGNDTISVNVRVLAATNRDLRAGIAAGTFREDLFYRLNVFPIHLPALRQRREDIPLLVEYLVERYGKKAGKKIRNITKETLDLFQSYDWPGNIRELQNVVERAVILCYSDTFSVDETWLQRESRHSRGPTVPLITNLSEREKEMIESALAECRGRISGPAGAAVKLGIPRQTLESRIAKLGIDRYRFKSGRALSA